jgi:phosphoesterase RecJ-like protein
MKTILQNLKRYNRFLLMTHVNPDPDAVCSELALAEFLRRLGKKAVIIHEAPLAERLRMFPGARTVLSLESRKSVSYDAAVILDCGDLQRVGRAARFFKAGKPVFNIDHHITNTGFGDFNLVEPRASSTAEILFDLFQADRAGLTKNMAVNLYAGLMTDTGCFRYDNTTSKTHAIAAELMKFDIKASWMYQRIYEAIPLRDLKIFSQVVSAFQICYDGQIVLVELSRKVVESFSEAFDLRDAIFKYLRSIQGVKAIVILTEKTAKETRVNFRSSGEVNVAQLARHFDGGGHKNASGCQINKPLKMARQIVLDEIAKRL